MPEKTTFRDSALRAVAIIGLIAILVLGAWGIIQLVVGLPDFFSNFGGSPSASQSGEQIKVNPPALVTSGQPFTLAWVHTGGSGNYSFAISYSCAANLMFAAPVPTGQYQQVPCNTPFNYTNATGNVQLVAVLASGATQQVNTTITVVATRLSDNKITSTGSSTITVLPTKSATTPTTSTPKPTPKPASAYTPSGHTSNLYGNADLAVHILSAQPINGRYQIQFQISNVGTNVTPSGWTFQAQLPLSPTYTYQSLAQQKLYPGDKIVYTLGFDMSNMGNAYTYNANQYSTSYPYSNCSVSQNYTYNGYTNYPTDPTYNCNTASAYSAYPNYYSNVPNYYANTPSYYGSQFSITVDPQYLVNDSNRGNNTASVTLSN